MNTKGFWITFILEIVAIAIMVYGGYQFGYHRGYNQGEKDLLVNIVDDLR